LASGTGKLSGLFSGNAVTVYGSMTSTTFNNFPTLVIDQGATFSEKAGVSIGASNIVDDAGTLNLGAAVTKDSVVNAGVIETTGSGTITIAGALTSTGTLEAKGGELTVDGLVSGAGAAKINGGTLDLVAGFTQNVTFAGTSGELELGQSQGYVGTITGFSKTGGTSLDLVDIGFVSSTEATYSGTKTGGVLTVTDGTHTAHITLKGNYLLSTFVASSDGHGGTIVVDPTGNGDQATPPNLSPHSLIAAMAALGAPGGFTTRSFESLPAREPLVARPHLMSV
jgi:large repetitive protein